ncbi:hypothetical protein CHRY9390_01949 [Chryseobacterium aquaeductus]|uniref:YcxB-like protein domain-containing protein n=1 Tax=Chryseobacterium aquaeductus TaxID=2675056 RepID=A0A9N8MGB4_9FLAO|nr:hypothetical protein CHRY9390_01949 [Chryseobacterium potabilaquae]CAD7809144.1 hypothetical protein CHRY9390_01949 [Chryseobacterium aquaeductus]
MSSKFNIFTETTIHVESSLQVFINFNEKITRKQLEKYYLFSWKKKLPSLLKNFFFIVLFLTIIDSIFKEDRSRIDFLNFIGIFLTVYVVLYVAIFYFNKANYISKTNKYIAELREFSPVSELYFDENSFYLKTEPFDIRSIWKNISYEVLGKTVYITVKMGTPFTYIISEDETDQYQNILDFLKKKSNTKKT